jgi:hypothetical protein
MKKVIRLTESDLVRIVKRIVNEQQNGNDIKTLESMLVKNGFKKTSDGTMTFFYPSIGGNGVFVVYDTRSSQCTIGMRLPNLTQSYDKTFKFPINVNDVVNYALKLKNLYDANKNRNYNIVNNSK